MGIDGVAGEGEFERVFAGDAAANGDEGGMAEPAAFSAGGGEGGLFGGDGEVAGGDELATGGGGEPVDAGDDDLGDALHGFHQVGAGPEEFAHFFEAGAGHFGEVVSGGEDGAVACEDDAEGVRFASLAEGVA